MQWDNQFMKIFRDAVARFYEHPGTPKTQFFLPEECQFLSTIGCTANELYDYVKDYATLGAPSPSTILLIVATRRCFFLTSQRGISGNAEPVTENDLPAETDDFQEIVYLPRLMRKAEAKLHGTLGDGLMYYCEKDREFLRTHGDIHPADFLQLTWTAHGDRQRMVTAVMNAMKAAQKTPQRGNVVSMPQASQGELPLE